MPTMCNNWSYYMKKNAFFSSVAITTYAQIKSLILTGIYAKRDLPRDWFSLYRSTLHALPKISQLWTNLKIKINIYTCTINKRTFISLFNIILFLCLNCVPMITSILNRKKPNFQDLESTLTVKNMLHNSHGNSD